MSDFLNIDRGGAKQESESVGGGRTILDSNIYAATVKQVYLDAYESGAKFASITLDIAGKDYEERLLLTNSQGQGYWTDKQGESQQFSGLTRLDELAFAIGAGTLANADIGPANIRAWDKDSRSFLLRQHATVVRAATGKQVLVAILKTIKNKEDKGPIVNNKQTYVKNNEKEEVNSIEKFANLQKQTQLEAAKNVNPPQFMQAWNDKWSGNTRDTYKTQANAVSTGTPTATAAAASTNLFG